MQNVHPEVDLDLKTRPNLQYQSVGNDVIIFLHVNDLKSHVFNSKSYSPTKDVCLGCKPYFSNTAVTQSGGLTSYKTMFNQLFLQKMSVQSQQCDSFFLMFLSFIMLEFISFCGLSIFLICLGVFFVILFNFI